MGQVEQTILIKDALVFLFAAGLIVPLLRAVKIPTVAGFILAGLALGPSGIGALSGEFRVLEFVSISEPEAAKPFAELGVLFLLFLLGLELSFEKLWALRRIVFGVGLTQTLLCALVIGIAAFMAGQPAPGAAIIGMALALSSTAIVMQLLNDDKKSAAPVGRTALGVLLMQDLLVAPILIFAGFASVASESSVLETLLRALVQGALAIAVIFFAGRYLLRPLFHLAARTGGRDFLMAITLLTVVGAAVITGTAGLSIALGAFLAGVLLGETEFKHQTEVDLEPFKGLLLGLFFMTMGFGFDISAVIAQWPLVLAGVIALLLVKSLVTAFAVRVFVGGPALAAESALLLAPAGEFAFVIVAAATAGGIISFQAASLVGAIAAVTMLLTPPLWRLGRWTGARFGPDEPAHSLPDDYSSIEGHVIIAGFGRVGRAVARILEHENTEIVALERDPGSVARERANGRRVYLGDGSREEVLVKAGLRGASMIVVTLDDPVSAEKMVRIGRRLMPELPILARAKDPEHARELYAAGANFVVPDAIEAGLQMSARALEEIGYGGEAVRTLIAAERDAEYSRANGS
ncbi:MAG TPA: cation:proton antiporter, partial [Paracoccaceae bacterium]